MQKLTYRRTLNIGDYETISFEVVEEHDDLNIARLNAVAKCLELMKQELIRIYNVKLTTASAWDRVNFELSGIVSELEQLKRK